MDEDINDEFDIKNKKQFEDCELDNAETINIPKTIDIELSEKILENQIQISQPLCDISNCYQQSGSLNSMEENLHDLYHLKLTIFKVN
ncbi:unnamed protein product [Rhizophagus irregularis]|nr:unnamed protein product [Rhizophagus irregularis]